MKLNLAILIVALLPTATGARDLALERVFQSPALSGPSPREPKLSPDGTLATVLRNRADDRERFDLWAIDTKTGAARMLVDSAKIGSGAELSEAENMRRERLRIAGSKGITEYQWAPDGKSILVPIDGDLYLSTREGAVRRLTETSETELDARISEGGRYLSFVRGHDPFVLDLVKGGETRLTQDGSDTLSWGVAEFVAQEEMGRREGHWLLISTES